MVLPFANASGDPDAEYLSEGITEAIINHLSRLAKLRVVPRNTAFRYKTREADTATLRRELGVDAVVTGRVMQRGESLVVSSELVDLASDAQLWGERYNRKLSEIFAVQEEIAAQVAEALRLKLTGEEKQRLARQHTQNQEAYLLYLKGVITGPGELRIGSSAPSLTSSEQSRKTPVTLWPTPGWRSAPSSCHGSAS